MLKTSELRTKSEKELLALISELKGKLLALRFENAIGQLAEIHLIKETRRDIARVFTVLKQQQAGVEVKPAKKTATTKATTVKETASVEEGSVYSKMTVAQLKEIAAAGSIEIPSTAKKADIIKLIEEAKKG